MDLEQGSVLPGDVFVICSDGLTGTVSDGDILLAADTSAPQWACEALLALTLERGAPDNVTVVILRCGYAQPDAGPVGRTATVTSPARPVLGGDAR